jgi:glycosyltransferase involved in cell wall biosynthesis
MMISITVPVFNEAESIPMLYRRVRKVMEKIGLDWELILVNDGSTDDSEAILDNLAEQDPAVKVVHFRRNFGQTAAMMAGFDFASGDVIIPMDGDLQNDPRDIPKVLEKIDEGFDCVSGWRRDRKDDALQRNLPSIMANKLISFVSGVRLHDFGCSLKAYRREIIKGVRLYGEMHRFLPIYASWHGAKICEVVVNHHERTHGRSKYGIERVLKVLLDLVVVQFLDKYGQKPMYLFGGVGFFSLLVSALCTAWAVCLKLVWHKAFIETPVPLLVIVTALMGVMCIFMGLLAEMIMRTFYESQGKSVYMVRSTRNMNSSAPSLPAPAPDGVALP